jgi:Enoyl-(Acyl carrier protein) reductase
MFGSEQECIPSARGHVRPQRQGRVIHRAEGLAATGRRIFGDSHGLHDGQHRQRRPQRLRRVEGRRALVRAQLDPRPQGPKHRINTLSPGATKTEGLLAAAGSDPAQLQGFLGYLASQVPMGRVADPDEIARAAVFLASDDSSFVTGSEMLVDGGQAQT